MNDEAGRQARSDNDSAAPRLAAAPAVVIRLELEAPPRIYCDVMTEAAGGRLTDWLASHPDYLELVNRAIELGERARAA
jgi:hypothetical protein